MNVLLQKLNKNLINIINSYQFNYYNLLKIYPNQPIKINVELNIEKLMYDCIKNGYNGFFIDNNIYNIIDKQNIINQIKTSKVYLNYCILMILITIHFKYILISIPNVIIY